MAWFRRKKPDDRKTPKRNPQRAFASAKLNNLTASWTTTERPADTDIQNALNTLRARSRNEYQSNDYAKKAVNLFKQNVIGRDGIRLQARPLRRNGDLDLPAATAIEEAYKDFSMRGVPEVTGQRSRIDVENLFISSLIIDGEVILLAQNGWRRNKYGFAVQFIDPVLLDVELNKTLTNGNIIRMGVELDQFRSPVAYHLISQDAGQTEYRLSAMRKHTRIPAQRILHAFLPEYVYQTRGVPGLSVSLMRYNMLKGYEDAELTAARVAAAKMGFFEDSEDGSGYLGEELDSDDEPLIDAAEPGKFGRLPNGVKFEPWDPQHPTAQYKDYVKAVLRGAASGANVPYNSMANDLEGVNFSALRQGNLDAQDVWRCCQRFTIDTLETWMYRWWLNQSLLTGAIEIRPGSPLNGELKQKYLRVTWQPRTWEHVQPREQENANDMRIKNRTKSTSQIIRDQGGDPDETFREIAEERAKMEAMGILPVEEANNGNQNPENTAISQNG